TIDGVTLVIDSGLHKVSRSSAWTGLTALELEGIPQDSAVQRAGRAGRTAPGRCIRLYSENDLRSRPRRLDPEIRRVDIASEVLSLATLGVTSVDALPWLTAPEPARWERALNLLVALGFLSRSHSVTSLGRRASRLPLHPRFARLLTEAADRGATRAAASAIAALSEGTRLPSGLRADTSDLVALARLRPRGQAHRVRKQLLGAVSTRVTPVGTEDEALRWATLHAFSDRVARRRSPESDVFTLESGGDATLDDRSTVRTFDWIVAIEVADGFRGPTIRLASAIEPDWLLELPGADEDLSETVDARWVDKSERVEARETLRWRGLVLESSTINPRGRTEPTDLLIQKARAAGPGRFADVAAVEELVARRQFAHSVDESIPTLTPELVLERIEGLCQNAATFREIRDAKLLALLESELDWSVLQRFEKLAPMHVTLQSGHRSRVRYPPASPPRISDYLKYFLGMSDGPTLGSERFPVLIELLAPNRRPVALTSDLRGFWERTWPEVRKELRGRYPRHPWPEDPTVPPPPRKPRKPRS
ncbi:MAG: ATP-dependent helicase HrpB, partial [Myxococcota bacterium]